MKEQTIFVDQSQCSQNTYIGQHSNLISNNENCIHELSKQITMNKDLSESKKS